MSNQNDVLIHPVCHRSGMVSYVIGSKRQPDAIVIDPGEQLSSLEEVLSQHHWTVSNVFLTHGHIRHCARAGEVALRWKSQVACHVSELPALQQLPSWGERIGLCGVHIPHVDRFLKQGDWISVGQIKIQVYETPGHTSGSLSIRIGRNWFVGDLVSFGLQDLSGTDEEKEVWEMSLTNLLAWVSEKDRIYPSHGPSFEGGGCPES